MLTLTRIAASRTTSLVLPKAAVASGISSRFFAGIADDLAHKKKVDEDRWIRSVEHEAYLKRKAAQDAAKTKMTIEEVVAKEAHDVAVGEAFAILSITGCQVEDAAVEALAKWKLGK